MVYSLISFGLEASCRVELQSLMSIACRAGSHKNLTEQKQKKRRRSLQLIIRVIGSKRREDDLNYRNLVVFKRLIGRLPPEHPLIRTKYLRPGKAITRVIDFGSACQGH